jgi:hypothetical protein
MDISTSEKIEKIISDSNISLQGRIVKTLRVVIASLEGKSLDYAGKTIDGIINSKKILNKLDKNAYEIYKGIFEIIRHEIVITHKEKFSLSNLAILKLYSKNVKEEVKVIVNNVDLFKELDGNSIWFTLIEEVQRIETKTNANYLIEGIEDNLNAEELIKRYNNIDLPTTKRSKSKGQNSLTTAKVVINKNYTSISNGDTIRFSSGLPTLDHGYTNKNEKLGFITPGQFIVVMGATGTGKSSFVNTITPAIGQDLINYGLIDAKQVLFHTEEESIDKIKGFKMSPNDKFYHLADNLIIENVGTSRKKMTEVLYDLVIEADSRAKKENRSILEFLPYVVQLDYIQSIIETFEDEVKASAVTAEFLLRGVSAWNPTEMAKFGGVNFREYSGMSWPAGMENHRVAVIGYAQLVKINDESLFYRAGKRNQNIEDFVILDENNKPYWDVKENDLRLFRKNQMRGSGVIANNAHAIIILHRSVPYNNPSITDKEGRTTLTDTRARILFDKSRTGSRIAYAPLKFDVMKNGFRTQFYDELAERAINFGKLTNFDKNTHIEYGDPILPIREEIDPLKQVRY